MIIKLENISKIYKNNSSIETVALRNINLEINKGEFVSIMGPSGSGKSTLMHIIGLLDSPTEGRYLLEGNDVSSLSEDILAEIRNRKIGFVFQAFYLLSRKNVIENVILPSLYADYSHSLRRQKALKCLEAVAFPEKFIHYYPNQLSGGMMQRVAIARALMNDPEIILADEPTGNLDTKTGEAVIATFQRLNKERGLTIIIITHEEYIAEHTERIILLRDGQIIAENKVLNSRSLV
ncbi:MAG: ABC transporter ATP-binding protein [Patescibacteria group bacterium]|nr:ABC transporter ATP-binding protein [Patescibacteria group bacterium]